MKKSHISGFPIWVMAGLMLAALACGRQEKQSDGVIHVQLSDNRIEWQELFDSIRVIPLENSDSVLLTGADRVEVRDGDIYVLNRSRVYRFDSYGNFINTIGRIGKGPGEYRYAYDFDFNPESENIFLLSPFGTAYEYTTRGEFIAAHELPAQPNYQRLRRMNDGKWLGWTFSFYGEDPISIISEDLSECILTPKLDFHAVNVGWATPNFFTHDSVLYMSPIFDQTTYMVTSDTILPAYTWDFGEGNNLDEAVLAKYDVEVSNDPSVNNERKKAFYKDLGVKFSLYTTGINNSLIFQKLVERVETDENFMYLHQPRAWFIFHNRNTGKNIVGTQIGEGMMGGKILYMNDDYLLMKLYWEDFPFMEEFLPEGMTLADINPDDDNPMLVKYYFKK